MTNLGYHCTLNTCDIIPLWVYIYKHNKDDYDHNESTSICQPMYDEQHYEICLQIDGRSVCCGFAVSKNITSLGMNVKYFKKTFSVTAY